MYDMRIRGDSIYGLSLKCISSTIDPFLCRHAKKYVEEHSGDLNRLQHFTETRIRVRNEVLCLCFIVAILTLHITQFSFWIKYSPMPE